MLESSRLRIIVIDDNHDAADMLGWLLEADGHEVQIVYSGQLGLELTATFQPDVIFCDLGMPMMSGYEFAQHVRAQDLPRQPLLITVSGWGDPLTRTRTGAAGFDLHLVKPADIGAVRTILASHSRTLAASAP